MRVLAPHTGQIGLGEAVDSGASRALQAATRLLALHRELDDAPSLEPGPRTDALFRELVATCQPGVEEHAARVLADPRITPVAPRIRALCAEGEFRLERAWARRIISAGDPQTTAKAFPYLENYSALTRLELSALAGVGIDLDRVRRVCFLGGGPLPLSALLLERELCVPVDVVDRDGEAVSLAEGVTRRLASESVRIHQGEAATFGGVADCDLVLLAALVGTTRQEKAAVIERLHATMRPGSTLVIRSAHGLRTLLYPALHLADLAGWKPLAVVHPLTDVVNSVVVAAHA